MSDETTTAAEDMGASIAKQFEDWKAINAMTARQAPCTNCGYCPSCGRSDRQVPLYGDQYTRPYSPYPFGTQVWCGTDPSSGSAMTTPSTAWTLTNGTITVKNTGDDGKRFGIASSSSMPWNMNEANS